MGFPIPSGKEGKVKGYHCWADYYIDGEGWYPVDISEADKDPSKAEYFFGTVDESRVEMMIGRDFSLDEYSSNPVNLFIYPLFLAERFFLLGIMQAFFPLVISLAVFEKFRSLAYTFFKLYAAVYMLVPAFFLVNVFVNALYTEINTNFWVNLFGTDVGSGFFAPVVQLGSVGFIVFLKFKLYRRATSFTLRLFTN